MTACPRDVSELARRIIDRRYSAEEIAERVKAIHEGVRRRSARMVVGDFTHAADSDLALLFDLYDEQFFAGDLRRLVTAGGAPLEFAFSSRLTRSGGLTKRFAERRPGAPAARYQIVLSSTLLFQTFKDVARVVRVNGIVCADRLEAAQRIFEHELLHLIEMLVWTKSSCNARRFADLAWNLFGHTQTRHDLVTQNERARTLVGVRVGDLVRFTFEGRAYIGRINRITRRATVLVEDPTGRPFGDGKRYLKFYLPLTMLEKAGQ